MAATKYRRRLIRRATVIVRYFERTQIKLTYNRRIIITENGQNTINYCKSRRILGNSELKCSIFRVNTVLISIIPNILCTMLFTCK